MRRRAFLRCRKPPAFGFALWHTFGYDLQESARTANALMKNFGLSADEFASGLISGSEAGVFSIDKVGDAVKKFNLRVIDGSNTTTEGFQALGMDADTMAARFAAGGDSARVPVRGLDLAAGHVIGHVLQVAGDAPDFES